MEHYDWNDGWLFTPVFDPAIVRPECPELTLEPVRLPHTVKALPYNYCNENDYQKLSGYRREFFAPKEWEGRTVLLTFGAVAHDATVFCNGRRVFHHSCGYTAFTVDLTSALHLGQKNVVAVRCDSREDLNIPPFGGQMDFLTYGGICRAVCLDVKEPAYLRDIFIETKAEGDFRIYTATVGETVGCTLQAEIRSPSGSRAFYTGELSLPITGALNSVHPWSIEHPTLYTLTVRLIRPGTGGLPDRVLDEKSCRFGFRTLQFVAGGLYLNGQRVELRGLNRRQSYAYQGYAMPDSIQRLDAQLLKKQLGCNAVRLTTPPSPAFLDACDELGLLVFVEMPGWQHVGDDIWKAQALQNCREMVCQCRSHPSIFLWGVRVSGSADDESFYKRTNEAIHRLDPTRPTPQPASGRCLRLCRLLLPRARRRVRGPHRRHPRHPERLSHQRIRGCPVPGQALRRRAPPPGAGPALRRRPQRHHRSAGRGGQLRLVHDRLQHPPRIRQRRPHQLSGCDGHVPQPEAFCRRLRQPEDAPLPF